MRVAILVVLVCLISKPSYAQRAADEFYDPAEMAAARAALKHHHGHTPVGLVLGERMEILSNGGDGLAVWEGQAWYGTDLKKWWFKTEGVYETAHNAFDDLELQVLYSRAVHSFWDLQYGIRHDVRPGPARTYATVGVQGLAPYWFEIDAAAFVSEQGDISARLEVEYELRFTQRLILQPRLELIAALSDDQETGLGAGVSSLQAGLRLRYELVREFAPYVGVSWNQAFGNTQDFLQADGEPSHDTSVVAGFRFWF